MGAQGKLVSLVILAMIINLSTCHEIVKRQATLQLDGDNNYLYSALILVPIILAIVVLDFAIFGTFASRSDELNPVSRFFFHARNGLQNIRNRRRNSLAHYYHHRQQRSKLKIKLIQEKRFLKSFHKQILTDDFLSFFRSVEEFGPIVDALHKAEEHYQ